MIFQVLNCNSSLGSCCQGKLLSSVLWIVGDISEIIQIIVPILLLLMVCVNLTQLMTNPEDKKKISAIKNKVIAAVIGDSNVKLVKNDSHKKASIVRRNAKVLDAWANTPIRTLGGRERTADQRKAEAFVDKAWGLIGLYPVSKFYHEFKGFFKNNN